MTNTTKKIVVVEDDQLLSSMIKTALEKEGYDVVIALDGEKGLELIQEHKPDILLLDIMLPSGIDGFGVLEKLKEDDILKDVGKVIMLSNLSKETDIAKARELGAQDYLIKAQYSLDEIVKKINSLS